MKKVAILTQFFYPENVTAGNLAFQTAESLVADGMDITVITGKSRIYNNEKKIKTKEVKNGIKINRIRYLNFKRKSKLFRIISYISFITSFYLNILKFRKFDLMVVYSSPPVLPKIAILVNKLFKTKIMFVSYDVYPEIAINMGAIKEKGLISNNTRRMNRQLFKRVSSVVALSNEMKDFLVQNRNIEENKVVVIPNWHEDLLAENKEVNLNKFLNYKEFDDIVVSYFGNLGVLQDIRTIIESAKTINNKKIKYLFAGHGSKVEYINREIENNKLSNTSFKGYLSGDDFREAVQISDVFIVSLEKEGTGLAVPSKTYSYLMGGKPIIAIIDENTDIAKELIEYNAGFVVNSNDIEGFNNVINTLSENHELTKDMGNNARNLFLEKYTIEKNVEKYKEEINKILILKD